HQPDPVQARRHHRRRPRRVDPGAQGLRQETAAGGRGQAMSRPAGTEQAWTLGGLLDWTISYLTQKGSESPRLDAQVLLAHVVGCQRIDLYGVRHGETAGDEVRQKFRDLVRRRVEGCPVAYLVGRKEFYSLQLEVGPAVLIPRPDSELLVTECLALVKGLAEPRVLDLGTGSGNLAVAVAHQHRKARVTARDVSPHAPARAPPHPPPPRVAHPVRL